MANAYWYQFTFTADQEASKDEMDFELPGTYWQKGNGNGQVQYGSYDPEDMSNQRKEFQYYSYTAEDQPAGRFLDYECVITLVKWSKPELMLFAELLG